MSAPDLKDPVQRAAYQRELRGVLPGVRYAGVGLAMAGALVAALRHKGWIAVPAWIPGGMIGIALMLMLTGVAARTRYHARRMRD
jgi:hypothetical protein